MKQKRYLWIWQSHQTRSEITPEAKIPLFAEKSPVVEELEKMEIDSLTILEALTKLYELQKIAKE